MKRYVIAAEGLTSKQRISIASKSKDPKELSRLAYDNSAKVRLEVLKNYHTPQKVVEMLCEEFKDGPDAVRYSVAERTSDPDLLAFLANDSNDIVREQVAERIKDPEILAKLAEDKAYNVRAAVASSADDLDILSKLASDEDEFVRRAVAEHATDPEIISMLAEDPKGGVREAVAENTSDSAILSMLADDTTYYVRRAVAKSTDDIELLERLAHDVNYRVRGAIALRQDNPKQLEVELANDPEPLVRTYLAENASDPEVLTKLADDLISYVRDSAKARMKKLGISRRSKRLDKEANNRHNNLPQTDWSVPLYSISNYTEIESEIKDVIKQAATAYADEYFGESAKVTCPEGVFDNGGTVTIQIGDSTYAIDADDILSPATSRNKKKDCVKTLIAWMTKNLK